MKGVIPLYEAEEVKADDGDDSVAGSIESRQQEVDANEDYIEFVDEEENSVYLQVIRYFYYNGEEYVVLGVDPTTNSNEDTTAKDEIYIMKVVLEEGDSDVKLETFEPIENEVLLNNLIRIASQKVEWKRFK